MDKLWHTLEIAEAEDELDTDSSGGLTVSSAEKRGKIKKSNDALKTLRTFFCAFLAGFADITVAILAVSAIISFFMGAGADAILILCITVINSVIGALRTVKNKKITGYAHSLRAPYARVLRGGIERLIAADEVVCGDVVILKKGDIIYFGGRVTYTDGLVIKGSAEAERTAVTERLVGEETEPYANLVYPGDIVVSGGGRIIVYSEYTSDEDTIISTDIKEFGLHKKLIEVSRIVTAVIAVFCIGIFTVGVLQNRDVFDMLVVSACLAAAAVPNGLYSVVYSVLFSGAKMLGSKGITINSLYAADALSCVDCICTDKDGILTDNICKAERAAVVNKAWNLSEYGISDSDRSIIKMLFDFAVLAADVTDNGDKIIGAPAEVAVARYAKTNGTLKNMLDKKFPVAYRENEENYSVTAVKLKDGYRVIVKGDADVVAEMCCECVLSDGISAFSDELKEEISKKHKEMSANAMRVIAIAFKDTDEISEENENDFIFGGIIGISDSISQDTVKAVAACDKAGIKVVVTDSDCSDAVFAVAARSGIARADGDVITSSEAEVQSIDVLASGAEKTFAYAKLTSKLKGKISAALKAAGYTVAVTGNMNNDYTEIENADLGISINHERCTAVSNKADIVIDKGNFNTVFDAINIGRGIHANIKRVSSLVLTCGLSMLLLMAVALMILPEIPLLPIHILWTSLITDGLAAFALGCEPADRRLMRDAPRNKEKSVFGGRVWKRIICQSVAIGVLALSAFILGRYYMQNDGVSDAQALLTGRTMAFAVIGISQLLNALNLKSEYTLFNANMLANPQLLAALLSGLAIQVLIISLPVVNTLFGVCALSGTKWAVVIGLSLITVLLSEFLKISTALLKRRKSSKINAEGK